MKFEMDMGKRVVKVVKFLVLISAAIYAVNLFVPRRYAVPPLKECVGTRYWNLSTGSRLAYFHVAAKGSRKQYPIIYLHGGPGGHVRDELINSLSPLANEGYDIYFYDQVGSGLSGRLEDISEYRVDRHILDLHAIISNLGSDKVILIGQSWGAILATLYARSYPATISSLILTCPGPIFPVRDELTKIPAPDSLHLHKPFYTNAQGNRMVENMRSKAMHFFAARLGWKLASDEEADAFATFGGYAADRSTVCDTAKIPKMDAGAGFYAGVRTYKSLVETDDYRTELRKMNFPVLILKGQCDSQPWGYTSEYREVFKRHELKIIPSAGHFLWVEQPLQLRLAVISFLTDAARRGEVL